MLYQHTFTHKNLTIHGAMDTNFQLQITLRGTGNTEGTAAFLHMLSEMYAKLPAAHAADTIIVCDNYRGTPLRAQFQIGSWLVRHKSQTGKVAIVGAQPWEARIGKAVMKIARMKSIAFFKQQDAALAWIIRPT